ncbi:MAG: metal ABC transporter permease [Firmicutes bacterium]|nr:metal ABC transporter permease [Bacillota bacterium]
MLDFLQYPFMQRALIAAVLTGASCSIIGVFIVLKGYAFIGAGISQAGFAGVAFALLMGFNPLLGAFLGAILLVVLLTAFKRRADIKEDAAIGVLFSSSMALGVLFIGLMKHYPPDLLSYLFGNLLAVSQQTLKVMGIVASIIILLLIIFYRQIQYTMFDSESAFLSGIPTGLIYFAFLIAVAVTIVLSLQAVGQALVLALLIIPGTIAIQLTKRLPGVLILSGLLGIFASTVGMILSYYLDVPSGSTIVLVLGLLFAIITLFSPSRWRKKTKNLTRGSAL